MGVQRVNLDGIGRHTLFLQLSPHRDIPKGIKLGEKEAGGIIQHGQVEAATRQQRIIFMEFTQVVPDWIAQKSRPEQEAYFNEETRLMPFSLNNLFKAEKQGLREKMSDFHRFVLDERPDLVYVEPFVKQEFRRLFDKELAGREQLGLGVTGGSVAAAETALGLSAKKQFGGKKEKGRRMEAKKAVLSRRKFLKQAVLIASGLLAGVATGNELRQNKGWA